MAKRFYRSRNDKILGGVCGGVAHHLDVDPIIVRLLWIFLSFAWGSGIIAYIVCWIILPLEPKGNVTEVKGKEESPDAGEQESPDEREQGGSSHESGEKKSGILLLGVFFVSFGVLWSIGEYFNLPGFGGMIAILVGIMVITYYFMER